MTEQTDTEERENGQLELSGIDTPLGSSLKEFCDQCTKIEGLVKLRDELQEQVVEEMDKAGVNKVKFEGRTFTLVDPKPGKRHIRMRVSRPEDED